MDAIKFTQSARAGDGARRVWRNSTNLLSAAVGLSLCSPSAGAGGRGAGSHSGIINNARKTTCIQVWDSL